MSALLCFVIACGGNDKTSNETAASASSAEAAKMENDDSESRGDVQHQMPDGDQIEEACEAILEKAGVDDPELMEVHVSFSRSTTGPDRDDSNLSVKLVSPQDKNEVLFYRYDFADKTIDEPREVTLSTGLGTIEKFIDTHDGFKNSLFKKSDIPDFDKEDAVYEEAIAKSEYGATKCYVNGLQFKHFPNGLRGSVSVQSTRSISAYKGFSVDKTGNMTAY